MLDGNVVRLVAICPLTRALDGLMKLWSSVSNRLQPQEVKGIEEHKGVSLSNGAILMVEGPVCVLCAVGRPELIC